MCTPLFFRQKWVSQEYGRGSSKYDPNTARNMVLTRGRRAHGRGQACAPTFLNFRPRLCPEQHGGAQGLNGTPTLVRQLGGYTLNFYSVRHTPNFVLICTHLREKHPFLSDLKASEITLYVINRQFTQQPGTLTRRPRQNKPDYFTHSRGIFPWSGSSSSGKQSNQRTYDTEQLNQRLYYHDTHFCLKRRGGGGYTHVSPFTFL